MSFDKSDRQIIEDALKDPEFRRWLSYELLPWLKRGRYTTIKKVERRVPVMKTFEDDEASFKTTFLHEKISAVTIIDDYDIFKEKLLHPSNTDCILHVN
jgi:hypothetical protein